MTIQHLYQQFQVTVFARNQMIFISVSLHFLLIRWCFSQKHHQHIYYCSRLDYYWRSSRDQYYYLLIIYRVFSKIRPFVDWCNIPEIISSHKFNLNKAKPLESSFSMGNQFDSPFFITQEKTNLILI